MKTGNIGRLFRNRYRIDSLVGHGAVSVVYKALDTLQDNTPVAIKFLESKQPNEFTKEYFRRETIALRRLDHPNVVRLLDFGYEESEEAFFLVLEYLPRNLAQIIREHKTGETAWLWPIIISLTDALNEAHSLGIIHRDIKPSNIMFNELGNPKIGDFGISRLKFDVCIGVTLSKFLSPGYSSPEQRAGHEADTWSDIYSLGAVVYHALAHRAPSSSGPSTEEINQLAVSASIKKLLLHMLADEPKDRIQNIGQLLPELESCKLPEIVPTAYIIVSEQAARDLIKLNEVPNDEFPRIRERLIDVLGGLNATELPMLLGEDRFTVNLICESLELKCSPNPDVSALVLNGVSVLWQPSMEKRIESALPVRVIWEPIKPGTLSTQDMNSRRESKNCLSSILDRLATHNKLQSVEAGLRIKRRNFADIWEQFLELETGTKQKKAPLLHYSKFAMDGEIALFELSEPAPDNLTWTEGTPMAVIVDRGYPKPIGKLSSIRGIQISVVLGLSAYRTEQMLRQIPKAGVLTESLADTLSAIRRQQTALNLFRSKTMASQTICEAITEPKKARFIVSPTAPIYFQEKLDVDKRAAVTNALAAKDLFLIQGPPGSGKTTVIAELIAQIRKSEPNARILMTSQSNVPVNHALAQVASIKGLPNTELIRIGREENIGKGAERWKVEEKLKTFREITLARCEKTIQILKEKAKQAQALQGTMDPNTNSALTAIQDWLNETKKMVEDLREYEQAAAALQTRLKSSNNTQDAQTLDLLVEIMDGGRKEIKNQLGVIRDLIPAEYRMPEKLTLEDELSNLNSSYSKYRRISTPDTPESKMLDLVNEWKLVVGNAPDFEEFLVDRANVVGATCLYSAGKAIADDIFDWVIVDEAGRATPPELLTVLVKARRAVLVGDEKQLPPFVDAEYSDEDLQACGMGEAGRRYLETSLFETLVSQASQEKPEIVCMLKTQYRMHPAIGTLVSEVFYEGQLVNKTDSQKLDHGLTWVPRPVVWYSTANLPNRSESKRGSSTLNVVETTVIKSLLSRMEIDYRKTDTKNLVGVISGYDAQIQELITHIVPEDREMWQALDIEIDTVDGFQGRECDIIIYSTVRSNKEGKIGFLRDPRRINVALSRSRKLLIIVGDIISMEHSSLSRLSNPFVKVVKHMRNHPEDCSISNWNEYDGN